MWLILFVQCNAVLLQPYYDFSVLYSFVFLIAMVENSALNVIDVNCWFVDGAKNPFALSTGWTVIISAKIMLNKIWTVLCQKDFFKH